MLRNWANHSSCSVTFINHQLTLLRMSARKGGSRAGTRRLFRKHPRSRGKISITKYFMPYAVGDRAVLLAEPAVQRSLYHQRFHGRAGVIVAKRGNCYELQIVDGGKQKIIVVHPVHMKKLGQQTMKTAREQATAKRAAASAKPASAEAPMSGSGPQVKPMQAKPQVKVPEMKKPEVRKV